MLQVGTAGQGDIQCDQNAKLVGFSVAVGSSRAFEGPTGQNRGLSGHSESISEFYLSTMNVCSVLGV